MTRTFFGSGRQLDEAAKGSDGFSTLVPSSGAVRDLLKRTDWPVEHSVRNFTGHHNAVAGGNWRRCDIQEVRLESRLPLWPQELGREVAARYQPQLQLLAPNQSTSF